MKFLEAIEYAFENDVEIRSVTWDIGLTVKFVQSEDIKRLKFLFNGKPSRDVVVHSELFKADWEVVNVH